MASKVKLDIAIAEYPHTAAILSGEIPIEGVEANFIRVHPQIAAYRRMVRQVEFDVCELAPTTYLIARGYGARLAFEFLGPHVQVLAHRLGECLNRLVQLKLVTTVRPEADATSSSDYLYQPARPLNRITLFEFKTLDDNLGITLAAGYAMKLLVT